MRNIIYIFFFMLVSANAQTSMSADESTILKNKVKAHATTINTLSSDFTQYKHLDFLSNDIVTSGKLAFKAPNIIKWEYTAPYKYSILFKNDKLFINDEGKKSDVDLGSSKMFKQLNTLIVNSVKGDMFDTTKFDISYLKKENHSEVHFSPKDEELSKYIKAFHITFNEKGHVIELKMIEPSDDYTKIVFNNRSINTPIPDAIFTE